MRDAEMFTIGVLLGVASSFLPSLPESVECWQDPHRRGYVLIPYAVVLVLTVYIVALGMRRK